MLKGTWTNIDRGKKKDKILLFINGDKFPSLHDVDEFIKTSLSLKA